ncbi:MAG: hypothetical protein ABIK07_20905 [Planctomycetota bacterium]
MREQIRAAVKGILCNGVVSDDAKIAWDLLISQQGERPVRLAMVASNGEVFLGKPGQPGLHSGVTLKATIDQLKNIMAGNYRLLTACIMDQPDLDKAMVAFKFEQCFKIPPTLH